MRWLAALAALTLTAATLPAQPADLAVIHARIYTVNPQQPLAGQIAVQGSRILAVGDDLSRYIGPNTRVIDAKGAILLPGLIDSHAHLRALGAALSELDLRGIASERAIAAKVRAAASTARPGEWILGRAWDQNLFADKQFPTFASLTAAAPDNPVYLTRVDGHAGWANQKALELAGVNAATKDPAGGKILRDAAGKPTGIFVDRAQGLITARIPASTGAQVEAQLKRAAEECARFGLTTIHDAGVGAQDLAAYRALIARQELPLRVYAMIAVPGAQSVWNFYRKMGPEIGDYLTVRSLKLVADGALGSRGAALLAPYSDDPGNNGLLILDQDFLTKVAKEAAAAGFQVNTHAIGDRANRAALHAYAAALGGPNDRRFRIEHAQIIAPADFVLFPKYSILASMQPTHATSDMPWAERRVGARRIQGAYAWQTLRKLGVHLPSGSDFPIESPDPLGGFYAAVTRQDHAGNPPGGWQPGQRMSREEALRSWTIEGAYAAFEEKQKGSLEPGKLADFILLSDDIMTMPAPGIWKTKVTLTVLGGRIVYQQ